MPVNLLRYQLKMKRLNLSLNHILYLGVTTIILIRQIPFIIIRS